MALTFNGYFVERNSQGTIYDFICIPCTMRISGCTDLGNLTKLYGILS